VAISVTLALISAYCLPIQVVAGGKAPIVVVQQEPHAGTLAPHPFYAVVLRTIVHHPDNGSQSLPVLDGLDCGAGVGRIVPVEDDNCQGLAGIVHGVLSSIAFNCGNLVNATSSHTRAF